jgi:hypothetical protein
VCSADIKLLNILTVQVLRVSIEELRDILRDGDMPMPAMITCFLALAELQRQNLLE